MEDTTILILVSILSIFGSFVVIVKSNFVKSKQRRTIKEAQDVNIITVTESYEQTIKVLQRQNELLVEESKSVKRRLAKEIGLNYKREEDNNSPSYMINSKNLDENYEIDMIKAMPLINSMKNSIPFLQNMDVTKINGLINNPIVKKFVWNYIKKNKTEMINLGVIVPRGSITHTGEVKSTNTQDEIQDNKETISNFQFNENNEKYMA